MADEAGTMTQAATTEKVEASAVPAGKTYTQADLDAITAKVRESAEKATLARVEEQKKTAEMSVDRARKEAEEAKGRINTLTSEATQAKRQVEILTLPEARAVPARYLNEQIAKLKPEDQFDPAAVAQAALAEWTKDRETYGGGSAQPAAKEAKKATPQGGTPSSAMNMSENDFSRMTKDAYDAKFRSLQQTAPREAQKFLADYKLFRAGGGHLIE